MKYSKFVLFLFLIFAPVQFAYSAPLVNGDFSDGLNSWSTSGTVNVVNNQAQLLDSTGDSSLFQQVGIPDNNFFYTYSFEFKDSVIGNVPNFSFSDSFYATLVHTNSNDFDPNNPSIEDEFVNLYFSSVFVESSIIGAEIEILSDGWRRLSYTFSTNFDFVIPIFSLYDGTGVVGSSVTLDNITLVAGAEIPEPSSMLLLGSGLAYLGRKRLKKK